MVSIHDWIFEFRIDSTSRHRRWPVSSTLVLAGFNIYEGLNIDDPGKLKGRDFVFRARGRDLKGAIFDLAALPKVDFSGAELEEGSLVGATLQGSSLDEAQLQGARLDWALLPDASLHRAQFQGASFAFASLPGAKLDDAQLQGSSFFASSVEGASLLNARLQGAFLDAAKLQGALLIGAKLQGASLTGAHLQGASLDFADLLGAKLDDAQLQGASLAYADLQGASLQLSYLRATDLSNADLWRTNRAQPPGSPSIAPQLTAIRLSDAKWQSSWDEKAYQDLRQMVELLPPDYQREGALKSIQSLDCASREKTLASCGSDPSVPPVPEAVAWRKALEGASVDDAVYTKAFAKILKTLACSGGTTQSTYCGASHPISLRHWSSRTALKQLVPKRQHLSISS